MVQPLYVSVTGICMAISLIGVESSGSPTAKYDWTRAFVNQNCGGKIIESSYLCAGNNKCLLFILFAT
jgi:hypothetical protein